MSDTTKPPLNFRRATRADVAEIVRLLADDVLGAKREHFAVPLPDSYYAAFAAIDADPNNELMVAECDGAVVGSLQLTFIPYLNFRGSWRALIESVHVASGMRCKGVGSALMRRAIARAEERGCRIVQLTTDKTRADAKRFYERLGFRATHEGMKLHLR
jgi:ribosomal protein S18 acetylase RimI-like enzyme